MIYLGKETIVRYECERCDIVEELKPSLFRRCPKGWVIIEGQLICDGCYIAFKKLFKSFIRKGVK